MTNLTQCKRSLQLHNPRLQSKSKGDFCKQLNMFATRVLGRCSSAQFRSFSSLSVQNTSKMTGRIPAWTCHRPFQTETKTAWRTWEGTTKAPGLTGMISYHLMFFSIKRGNRHQRYRSVNHVGFSCATQLFVVFQIHDYDQPNLFRVQAYNIIWLLNIITATLTIK